MPVILLKSFVIGVAAQLGATTTQIVMNRVAARRVA
jgi:hypothetical protein